ncbi:unnamed protein product [Umbelopsis sp. WA50703]
MNGQVVDMFKLRSSSAFGYGNKTILQDTLRTAHRYIARSSLRVTINFLTLYAIDDLIWLGQELNYTYVKPIFDKLSESHDSLQSRGEAHITVISPPEFSVLAAANVTIDDINKIAVDYEIQASNFEVICLGRAKVEDNTVYQIIVYSDDLVRIRTRIFQLYWNNGGNPALFDPKKTASTKESTYAGDL